MTSTNTPCQRCRKARAKCTIGSSLRVDPAQERPKDLPRERDANQSLNTPPSENSRPSPSQRNFTQTPRQPSWESAVDDQSPSDSLQLGSVPWPDIINSTFEGNQELHFGGEASVLSMTGSTGGLMTPNELDGLGAIAASYPFPSTDNFDMSPPFQVSANQPLGTRNNKELVGVVALNQTSAANEPPISRHESLQPAPAREQSPTSMVLLSNLFALDDIHSPSPADRSKPWSSSGLGPSPTELKDAGIQKLSDLSAGLMKDLHRLVTCKLASSFIFAPSDKNTAGYLFKTLDGSMSQENAIGRMLHGSERFLEIVHFLSQPPLTPCSSSEQSLEGDTYNYGDLENAPDVPELSPETRIEERWKTLQSYLSRRNPSATTFSTPSTSTSNSASVQLQKNDIPSTLAILTCYTCLLKIYESVFFVIHHSLECSPAWASAIKLPQTVPYLQINGFMLQNHRNLQIKILIQVSTYMLDAIEKALGGMLADPMFQALLKTLLKQEGLDCSQHNETGMKSVRDLMQKINSTVN